MPSLRRKPRARSSQLSSLQLDADDHPFVRYRLHRGCRRWHSGTHAVHQGANDRGHTDHAETQWACCPGTRPHDLCSSALLRMTTTTISRQSSGGTRRRGSARTARRSTSLMTRDALLYRTRTSTAASTSAGPPPSPYSASHWSLSWCSQRRSRKPPSVNHKHASSSPPRSCAAGRSCAGFSCTVSLLSSSASSRPASQLTRSLALPAARAWSLPPRLRLRATRHAYGAKHGRGGSKYLLLYQRACH